MKTITKILTLGTIMMLTACDAKVSVVSTNTNADADAFVLLFAVHTTNKELPTNIGLAMKPSLFTTQALCEDAKQKIIATFTEDDSVKFFTNNQIDKKALVCVPIKF